MNDVLVIKALKCNIRLLVIKCGLPKDVYILEFMQTVNSVVDNLVSTDTNFAHTITEDTHIHIFNEIVSNLQILNKL